MKLTGPDPYIVALYLLGMVMLGIALSMRRRSADAGDYFLAGRSLPWWAIGGSLIASNISAEQFIGMSGSGFKIGLAIASYEFMAAITLILIAWFVLPVFLKMRIDTMPQFVEKRYGRPVRTGLAIFWLVLFVFVNITSVLYLGALTLQATLGWPLVGGIVLLAAYSAAFSIFGGLRTVVFTDMVQVVVLLAGGFLTTVLALQAVGDGGVLDGLTTLVRTVPEKFDLILFQGDLVYATDDGGSRDAWLDLPGLSVLLGGMWIANLYYWGTNQYIIQRALGAKSLSEARKGVGLAALVKLVLPIIVVVPGIVAAALDAPVEKGDQVYAWVLTTFIPVGLKGICFAAVIAAVGSSISSMVNSASTIFTLDLYRPYIRTDAPEKHYVAVGKWAAAAGLVIGVVVAPSLRSLDQAFQFIQNLTGYFSPGILVIFLFGLFWARSTRQAAFAVVLASLPVSLGLDMVFPEETLPFLNRMGVSFLVLSALMIGLSLATGHGRDAKATDLDGSMFRVSTGFLLTALAVVAVLAVLYGALG